MATITARQRILALISHRGPSSAAQIGRSLSMSPAAVRHHLAILQRDGRIVEQRAGAKAGRGRPAKVYRVSDRLLGENLAGLSDSLLRTWLGPMPEARRGAALRSLGNSMGKDAGAVETSLPVPKRLVQLIDRLNALSYQARWEAGAQGPRVLLGHCPYAALIGKHPELCIIDAAFLAALGGAPVEQLTKMDSKPGGPTHCVFAVSEARPPARA